VSSTVDAAPALDLDRWSGLVDRGWTRADAFADRAAEHAALRSAAAADLGTARILDGHRNALERLLRHRPQDVAPELRAEAADGTTPLGVWGADPRAGEGDPARLGEDGTTVSGVKTFCSGAGLVRRALVLVRRTPDGPPSTCVYVDPTDPRSTVVDERWFAGDALRSSLSHRVVFDRAPVLAVLGPPGTLAEEPWFAGDALRTTVTWAGALDAVVSGVDDALRTRSVSDAEAAQVARLHVARATVDRWLDHATALREDDHRAAPRAVLLARLAITEQIREALRLAAELTGSHALATATRVARARRDLDLLLLQHRLTPAAVRLGHALLEGSR
jgi:alkylation response protein AidB-like acyl-CoA dehydrogenase